MTWLKKKKNWRVFKVACDKEVIAISLRSDSSRVLHGTSNMRASTMNSTRRAKDISEITQTTKYDEISFLKTDTTPGNEAGKRGNFTLSYRVF